MKLLNEGNQLKQMATYNKKRQKGMSPFTKLDAGDVEHNQAFFNNAMGNGKGECMAESYDEENEYETSALAGSFSMEIDEAEDDYDIECAELSIISAFEDGDLTESDFDLLMQEVDYKRYIIEGGDPDAYEPLDEKLDESVNTNKAHTRVIKEARKTRLPAWSKESAVATLDSFSGDGIIVQAQKAFEADNAIFTPVTFDNGAVVVKALSDDEVDVDVPQGAYCVIDHHTMDDFYYEVKVPAGCFVWDGKFWYYVEFSKEDEDDFHPDEIFGKEIYNELFTYFKERVEAAYDPDDVDYLFNDLDDASEYLPYTVHNEIFEFIEKSHEAIQAEWAKENESDDEDGEPIEESIEEIEADEKKVEPQTIDIRKALNDIDMNSMTTDFVNMYEAARLSLEDKQKLALMLAKGEDLNTIYDFLAGKLGDGYLHSESHVIDEDKENK